MKPTTINNFNPLDYRLLFKESPGLLLIITATADFTIVDASHEYLETIQANREEIIGRGILEVFPDDSNDLETRAVDQVRFSFNRVMQTRTTDTMSAFKYSILSAAAKHDGLSSERYWRVINKPFIAPDGNITHIFHRAEDVTEYVHWQQQQQQEQEFSKEQQNQIVNVESEIYEINKKLEKELNKIQRQWQVIADHAPLIAYIKDLQGRFTMVNRRFKSAFALEEKVILGKTCHHLLSREIADRCWANDLEVIKTQVPKYFEEVNDEPKGQHTYSSIKFPLFDSTGKMYSICTISTDITERKKMEQKIQRWKDKDLEKKNLLEALFSNMTDEVWFCNSEGYFTLFNPAAIREFVLDVKSGDAINVQKMVENLTILREDGSPRPMEETPSLRALKGEVIKNLEEIVFSPSSKQFTYRQVSSAPVINTQNVIIGSISLVRDITKQKQTEKLLRHSEERYHSIFNSMLEGFCIIEMLFDTNNHPIDYRFIEVNPTFEAQTGLKNVVGKRILELVPDNETYWFEIYGKVALTGESVRFINETKKLNRWFEVTAYKIDKKEINNNYKIAILFNDITEHKKAEQALQISETKYKTLFNLLPVGITISDFKGNIIESNKMADSIIGLSKEDQLRRKVDDQEWNIISVDGLPMPAKEFASTRALKEQELVENIEMGLVKSANEITWVNVSAIPIPIPLENYGVAIVYSDISERKKTEVALQESKAKLTAALDSTTDAVFISDVDGAFVEFNEAFATYHRFKDKSECSKRLSDCFKILDVHDNNDRPAPPNMWAVSRALRGETVRYTEYTLTRKDTGESWIGSYSFAPIRNKDNKIIGSVVVARDITEQKMAEKENIRKITDRLKLAIDTMKLGVWDMDIVSGNVYWDDRIYEIYGVDKKSTPATFELWQNVLIHPNDREHVMKVISESFRGEEVCNFEFRIVRPDGLLKHIRASTKMVKDSNGIPIRTIGINQDITEQKKTEALLLKTEKLGSLAVLVGGIAHDFNNLLCGLFGFIELSINCCKYQDYQSVHSLLLEASKMYSRARDLSQQLLTFSKGGTPIVKVQSLIPIIESSSRFALTGANVSLKFDLAADLWLSDVDENQMSRVIENIIINAKQAMPNGGVINISAKNISIATPLPIGLKNGNYVCVMIEDQGIGIAPEHMSQIFDPYFTTKQEGNGLGLATVYSIINKHQGTVEVTSTLGEGTTIYLYLPATISSDSKIEIGGGCDFHYRGKVLIMDDDKNLQKLHSKYFKNFGATVICAADGDEAIKLFKEASIAGQPFNLVMLDLTIPGGKGGRETILEIRKLDTTCIAIAASGHATDPVIVKTQEYGFNDALIKPYQMKDVIEVLKRCGCGA
ncbi:MAG: PAS domain S-box protein [Oligoflexia bacterium]|nr:PAS domain S-box protein [Oligoflexia bacterium]